LEDDSNSVCLVQGGVGCLRPLKHGPENYAEALSEREKRVSPAKDAHVVLVAYWAY
jgi:hypothetical protein